MQNELNQANIENTNVAVVADAAAPVLPFVLANTSELELIPLKRLCKSPLNMRKSAPTGIKELAANIAALGLQQNLVVHPMKPAAKKAQRFGVCAGQRRFLALELLLSEGKIDGDYLVSCKRVTIEQAIAVSTAENEMREAPHPADQVEAYRAMVDAGYSSEYIAALYGVDVKTVTRRLKLADMSPKLMKLFRADEIAIEQMKALSLASDHETQERVWFGAQQSWQRQPHELRNVLTKGEINAQHSLAARFVGLDAFELAGGTVRRDLFAESNQGWFTDNELMTRLAIEKMQPIADEVRAEGWKWVEVRTSFSYDDKADFSEIDTSPVNLTPELAEEQSRIEARQEEIETLQYSEEITDEKYEELQQEADTLQQRADEIEGIAQGYKPEEIALAGAVVYVAGDGNVRIVRGLVRAEEEADVRAMYQQDGDNQNAAQFVRSAPVTKAKGAHSEKLLLNLTAHRTAAVQCELAKNTHVALVALVHKLACDFIVKQYADGPSALQISSRAAVFDTERAAPELSRSSAYSDMKGHIKMWQMMFPQDRNELFAWLLQQDQHMLLSILAVCTALSINGVSRDEDPHAINEIARALELDLSAFWQPTRESYLNHVSKDRIASIVTNVVSQEDGKRVAKMKKGEAATEAEKLLTGKNWLPEFLAASEVKKPFHDYADDADLDEDSDDDTNGANENDSPVAALSVEQSEQPTADVDEAHTAAWPFPKAADFDREPNEQRPLDVAEVTTPAFAWPFPSANLHVRANAARHALTH